MPPTSQARPRQVPSSRRSRSWCRMASSCSDSMASIATMSRSSSAAHVVRRAGPACRQPQRRARRLAGGKELGQRILDRVVAHAQEPARKYCVAQIGTVGRHDSGAPSPTPPSGCTARAMVSSMAELASFTARASAGACWRSVSLKRPGYAQPCAGWWSVPPSAATAADTPPRCTSLACRGFPAPAPAPHAADSGPSSPGRPVRCC